MRADRLESPFGRHILKKRRRGPRPFISDFCNNICHNRSSPWHSFFFNDTATTEIYTLSLHDALPIRAPRDPYHAACGRGDDVLAAVLDRKSTRLNSSHEWSSYAVFCLKKKIDTLTLVDDRLEAFYDNPNDLRDYFRDIGRMVLAAEGRKANDSHADCYQYFCVPEYGTANGRLHFHAVHFMRTLPTGSVDPNFGRRVRNRRQ